MEKERNPVQGKKTKKKDFLKHQKLNQSIK